MLQRLNLLVLTHRKERAPAGYNGEGAALSEEAESGNATVDAQQIILAETL